MEEAAHLKWTNFQDNLNDTLKSLKGSPDFVDVTLACEDGKKIGVHRAILAASSPLFQSLLNEEKSDHRLVYLAGVKSEDVSSVVDFMYCGETKVHPTNVDSFLAITHDLKLEGLFMKNNINDDEEMFTISEENAKVKVKSCTDQMIKSQKSVWDGAEQTKKDSKGEDFVQEEAGEGEKEKKGETENQKETEEEKNEREDNNPGEPEKEKPGEKKEEIEKEKQKEGENAIEKIDEIEMEREMSKKEKEIQGEKEIQREKEIQKEKEMQREKEIQREKEQESEKQNEKGKNEKKIEQSKGNGENIKKNGENMKEKEQTVAKRTETKIKDTDEKIQKICKMCREMFTSCQIYREHKGKDHNIECPLQKTCKLRFVVEYYKTLHLYKAHKIGSRPWESLRPNKEESVTKLVDANLFGLEKNLVCKKCKKHFNNKDQQKHHEGLGHNYSCEKCDRSYIGEAAFKDLKVTHVRKTTVSPTKVATQPSLIAVEKHTFLCDQCDKNFTDRQQLKKHETKEHQTRCKATECNRTFGTHFTTRCTPRN